MGQCHGASGSAVRFWHARKCLMKQIQLPKVPVMSWPAMHWELPQLGSQSESVFPQFLRASKPQNRLLCNMQGSLPGAKVEQWYLKKEIQRNPHQLSAVEAWSSFKGRERPESSLWSQLKT